MENLLFKPVVEIKVKKEKGLNRPSVKLWLRSIAKDELKDLYFKELENKAYVETYGRLLFGVPDRWKGLYMQKYTDNGLVIGLEKMRLGASGEDVSILEEIIKKAVEILKKEGFIKIIKGGEQ